MDFSGVKIPFGVGDMLKSATSFLGTFGEWGVLSAAIIFTPAMVGMMFYFLEKARKDKAEMRNRRYEARERREMKHQEMTGER